MEHILSYEEARDLLISHVSPIGTESIPLGDCGGRILGEDVYARFSVPQFDRSPYDGYAFCAQDSETASKEQPVTLKITEEIPAGEVAKIPVETGYAAKILTGAMIPKGADVVVPFEVTKFTKDTVTIFREYKSGRNIVRCGEDVKAGEVIADCGFKIDAGLSGILASQNVGEVSVYRIPKVGIISTGSELLEVGSEAVPGKIYNSNQYMLSTAVKKLGCEAIVFGNAKDNVEAISEKITEALTVCDVLLLTGGVSVGDYDLTPEAMEKCGAKILFRHVAMKPGMACAYGVKDKKLICGLSGNPAAAITNYYAVAMPAIKKICGYKDFISKEIKINLLDNYEKKSKCDRLLRGKLELTDGTVGVHISGAQGNVILKSTIGCDAIAVIPAGSGPVSKGTQLKGFLI